MKPTPTYVLFAPGTRGPSVYHSSLKAARAEAERLAAGAGTVMICRYVEGVKRVTETRPLESNPLAPAPSYNEPIF